jgi:peptidoglycan/xylan/chitin deacetylase (PgdA/CDA1 family)
MHPQPNWMFNQIADDRDHMGMRIPGQDTFYGRGYERPVYFMSGEPQQRGKFMNATTGTSSTAGKFASAFALGHYLFDPQSSFLDKKDRNVYYYKAFNAHGYGLLRSGVTQTASVRSPYIYAEENWTDDMELASASLACITNQQIVHGVYIKDLASYREKYINEACEYAKKETVTPWFGSDTAKHYQWYPFINLGHYELAKQLTGKRRDTIVGYYKEGIQRVWNKAKTNAFYRGVPYIWCSNNLTTSFAIQCYWYRELTGDKTFSELEQANFDWLFGCNPWGTSMVYGLPSRGDTPADPHSAFTHLKNYPIDGGLVDGPVYGSIYKGLIGIKLYQPDEYEAFQSDLAVYHDDYGDYSTNEPTMDGTASLIYLLAAKEAEAGLSGSRAGKTFKKQFSYSHGGIIRGDSTQKNIALVFTGDEFVDGGDFISKTLAQQNVRASFFFTSKIYYGNNEKLITRLIKNRHFLGNHSAGHLLYCDWKKRDSLLVTKEEFWEDLMGLTERLAHLNDENGNPINLRNSQNYFLPPYEWYNDSISAWTTEFGKQLISFTPGTLSTADYTTPAMKNYRNSETIYQSVTDYEKASPSGLNGFILLMHIGTDPGRTDKFYHRLPELIKFLRAKGYHFQTVDELLKED